MSIFVICLGAFCLLGSILFFVEGSMLMGFLEIAVGILMLSSGYSAIKDERAKKEAADNLHYLYEQKKDEAKIPPYAQKVGKDEYWIWYVNETLYWFPATSEVAYADAKKIWFDKEKIRLFCAAKENIYYYTQTGELHTEVHGSGGGSSYSFLTGFHGKIDPIHISTSVHDNRYTQLLYKDKGQDYEFDFAFDDIAVLRRYLPEKDYEVVAQVEADKQIQQERMAEPNEEKDKPQEKEKLQKAKELLDAGLISQEEYEQARRKALADLLS